MITEEQFLEAKKVIDEYNQQQQRMEFEEQENFDYLEPCSVCGDIDGMVNQCCAGYDPLHYKNCGYS